MLSLATYDKSALRRQAQTYVLKVSVRQCDEEIKQPALTLGVPTSSSIRL